MPPKKGPKGKKKKKKVQINELGERVGNKLLAGMGLADISGEYSEVSGDGNTSGYINTSMELPRIGTDESKEEEDGNLLSSRSAQNVFLKSPMHQIEEEVEGEKHEEIK
jgi:hypothetical protein